MPRHIAAALLSGRAPLLARFLRILLLLLMLRLLTAARIVFIFRGALSVLRALLRIGHLKPPGICYPFLS